MKIEPQAPKQQLMDVTAAEEKRAAKARSKGKAKSPVATPPRRNSQVTGNLRANVASQNAVAARSAPRNVAQAEQALSRVVRGVQAQPQAVRSAHQQIDRESVLNLLSR